MFNWLLRLFGAGRAEVKEVAAKVKAAAVDEVAERREAMEATAVATKAKAKAKAKEKVNIIMIINLLFRILYYTIL